MKINTFGNNEYSAENYLQSLHDQNENTIENLKREADNVAFRMKYYGDDAKTHLFSLLNTIGDLKDDEDMHDECHPNADCAETAMTERCDELEKLLKDLRSNLKLAVKANKDEYVKDLLGECLEWIEKETHL